MNKLEVTNDRMDQFCDIIAEQCRELIHARKGDLLKAWQDTIAEAHESEGDFPKLKLAFGTTVDLEGDCIESVIRFTCAYKSAVQATLPDPEQLEFPEVRDGAGVTITTGDKVIDITGGSITARKKGAEK